MPKRKTEQDYHQLATEKGLVWLGGGLPPSTQAKTRWRCGNSHVWEMRYNCIQQGRGCPHCAGVSPKREEDYRNLAVERGLEWISSKLPKNTRGKTRWKCQEGHVWQATYSTIQQGRGCSRCAGLYPKQEYDYRVLAKENGIEWLGGKLPLSTKAKTRWRCQEGHVWEAVYSNVQQGIGCPVCSESKGEAEVARVLDVLGIAHTRQCTFEKCKNKYALRFDFGFSLYGCNFLIEYDGEQHFRPIAGWGGKAKLRKTQRHDQIKNEFAQKHGYILIRIPYTIGLDNISAYLCKALARSESP